MKKFLLIVVPGLLGLAAFSWLNSREIIIKSEDGKRSYKYRRCKRPSETDIELNQIDSEEKMDAN